MVSPAEILLLAYTSNTVDEASDHFRWGHRLDTSTWTFTGGVGAYCDRTKISGAGPYIVEMWRCGGSTLSRCGDVVDPHF